MPADLELLQGSWTVTTLEVDGQPLPASMLTNARIVIDGDRFTSTGMGAVYQGKLELPASKKTRHLNMRFDAGPEKRNTNLGIYKLSGDIWTICLATRGTVRPSRFATAPGSGFALETLTRGKAPEATNAKKRASKKVAPASSAPPTEFEGEWPLVSAVMNGKPMQQSDVQWVKRVTQGNRTTVYAGPQVMLQVEFTANSSTSPKAIDYLNLAGSNKGKTQLGIYEFEGDLLKFCIAAPGTPRPTQFQSTPSDRGTLTVWKK
jgi:uncharacterized protein (TIGR03067 family)